MRGLTALLVGGLLIGACAVPSDGGSAPSPAPAMKQRPAGATTSTAPSPPTAPPAERAPDPTGTRWSPTPGTTWQWQLSGTIDTSVDAEVYDVDLFDTPSTVIDRLHADGRKVICYMSAGSHEEWRPDAAAFPAAVLGRPLDGWPGERWLDVRRIDVLEPLMAARMDLCVAKGFDAVEPDNVDGYSNGSGFDISGEHQLAYNRMLARLAHERGLAIGLKNDLEQVADLVDDFDFAVNEECFAYRECAALRPFIDAGKAVFHAEYDASREQFCGTTAGMGFSSIRKRTELDAWRESC